MMKNAIFLSLCLLYCLSCGQTNESNSKLNDIRGVGSDLDKIHVFYQDGDEIKYGLYTQGLVMPSRHEDLEDIKSIPKKNYLEMLELSLDHVEPLKSMSIKESELIKEQKELYEKKKLIKARIKKIETAIKQNIKDQEHNESKTHLVQSAIAGINTALRSTSTLNEELALLNERKANYIHILTELNQDLESEQMAHIKLQSQKSKIETEQLEPIKEDLGKVEELLAQQREVMEEHRQALRLKINHIKSFFANDEALALYEGQKLYDILLIPFEAQSWGVRQEIKLEKGKFSQKYDHYNRPSGEPYFFPTEYNIEVPLGRTGLAYLSWQLENTWCENKIDYNSDFQVNNNSKSNVVKIKGKPYETAQYTIKNLQGAETLIYYHVLN